MSANTNRAKGAANRGANKARGYVNRGTTYLKGANKLVLALVGLFLLFVVGMIVYWIYQAVVRAKKGDDENPILVSGSIDASDPKNSKSWTLPTSSGSSSPNMSFTISFWMYIADWYYRVDEPKAIFIKGVSSGGAVAGKDAAPGIWLAPDKNNLIVATRILGSSVPKVCDVANIPIQKWVHVAYVLDNRTVDVYVDCKLERSCVLTGVPLLNNHKLHLFPKNLLFGSSANQTGFLGQLSSLRYFSSALRPVDIARLCNEGPHATKGVPSKDHHPSDGGDGDCPPGVYTDLRKVKSQLAVITEEVDNAINQENDHKKHKSPLWDIQVRGRHRPTIRRLNGGNGNGGGGGSADGYHCDISTGSCTPGAHPGTEGYYPSLESCTTGCKQGQQEAYRNYYQKKNY